MKNFLIVLLGLTISLTACDKNTTTGGSESGQLAGRIVYVNTDTLLSNYDYYDEVMKDFENKQFALENELQKKADSFQNEVALFQRRAQAGGLSEQQIISQQAALEKKQEEILIYRENAAMNLQQEQAEKIDELLNKVNSYLEKYNADDRYDMVIGYSKGGGVLYAKENLDITQDVIKGLNDDYEASKNKDKKKEEVTADSTKAE